MTLGLEERLESIVIQDVAPVVPIAPSDHSFAPLQGHSGVLEPLNLRLRQNLIELLFRRQDVLLEEEASDAKHKAHLRFPPVDRLQIHIPLLALLV